MPAVEAVAVPIDALRVKHCTQGFPIQMPGELDHLASITRPSRRRPLLPLRARPVGVLADVRMLHLPRSLVRPDEAWCDYQHVTEWRSAEQLRAAAAPAWPEIRHLIETATTTVRVLSADPARRDEALEALQVTAGSYLGALAGECGGLLVDNGWLRVLAAGTPVLPGLHQATSIAGAPSPWLEVAWDVMGGRFAINGGGLDAEAGEVCYWGPDTLDWSGTSGGHSRFVAWALGGGLTGFYESLRWDGWEREVADLGPDQGMSVYPPPFAVEGRAIAEASRKPVPIAELHGFYAEIATQVRDLPNGSSFRMRGTEE